MGIFDTIKSNVSKAVSSVVSDQKKRLTNVVDTFKAIGTNISQGKLMTGVPVASKYENTVVGKVATNITKPVMIAGIPAAVATAAAPAAVIPVVKAAAAKPLQAGAALLVGTTVLKSEKASKAVIEAPSKLNIFTSDVAKAIDTPNIQNLSDIYKNNPIIATAATAAIVAPIAGAAATALNTIAVRKNTDLMSTGLSEAQKQVNLMAGNAYAAGAAATAAPLASPQAAQQAAATAINTPAVAAAPKAVKKKTTKKKKKAAAKKKKKKASPRRPPAKKKKAPKRKAVKKKKPVKKVKRRASKGKKRKKR